MISIRIGKTIMTAIIKVVIPIRNISTNLKVELIDWLPTNNKLDNLNKYLGEECSKNPVEKHKVRRTIKHSIYGGVALEYNGELDSSCCKNAKKEKSLSKIAIYIYTLSFKTPILLSIYEFTLSHRIIVSMLNIS